MANLIYVEIGTPITFKSSGGSATFTPTSVGAGAGRISARYDLGVNRSRMFEWRAKTDWAATVGALATLDIYLCTSDGTIEDADLGTTDAAVSSANALANLHYIGSVVADTADTSAMHASGYCEINAQYVSVVWWNAAAVALGSTAGNHEFILTPVPDEVQ